MSDAIQTNIPTPPLSMDPKLVEASRQVQACIDQASQGLVDRRRLIELLFLALITKEHLLLIGPPGTAKSLAVKRAATAIQAHYFEYLLGRFSEPNELFGGLDLAALKEGRVQPVTSNMLPEAEIAFLDEIFLGSTAILNTLLGLLNERHFTRGAYRSQAPLRTCVGASNRMPTDSMLGAFADRFLLTLFLEPVADDSIEALLQGGWALDEGAASSHEASSQGASLSIEDLDTLSAAAQAVSMQPVRSIYAHLIRKMRLSGVKLSDRRIVKAQKLVAAAALLRGAREAAAQDLWVLIYLIQDPAQQAQVKDLLAQELSQAFNPVLPDSAKAAGYGAEALSGDLVSRAEGLLAKKPALPSDPAYEMWLVRLETLITSIDASFDETELSQELRMARLALKAPLDAAEAAASQPASADLRNWSPNLSHRHWMVQLGPAIAALSLPDLLRPGAPSLRLDWQVQIGEGIQALAFSDQLEGEACWLTVDFRQTQRGLIEHWSYEPARGRLDTRLGEPIPEPELGRDWSWFAYLGIGAFVADGTWRNALDFHPYDAKRATAITRRIERLPGHYLPRSINESLYSAAPFPCAKDDATLQIFNSPYEETCRVELRGHPQAPLRLISCRYQPDACIIFGNDHGQIAAVWIGPDRVLQA